jgi:hypothetical protein
MPTLRQTSEEGADPNRERFKLKLPAEEREFVDVLLRQIDRTAVECFNKECEIVRRDGGSDGIGSGEKGGISLEKCAEDEGSTRDAEIVAIEDEIGEGHWL